MVPLALSPESNFAGCPGLLVAVCSDGPVKFQVTVSPTDMDVFLGANSIVRRVDGLVLGERGGREGETAGAGRVAAGGWFASAEL